MAQDIGNGAAPVGTNVRISRYTWDPEQPGQHLGGLFQYPCAGATDPCQMLATVPRAAFGAGY